MAFKFEEIEMILNTFYFYCDRVTNRTVEYIRDKGLNTTDQSVRMFVKMNEALDKGKTYKEIAIQFKKSTKIIKQYCGAIDAWKKNNLEADNLEKVVND